MMTNKQQTTSKICTWCGRITPADVFYFYVKKDGALGLSSHCKKCGAKKDKENYLKNSGKKKAAVAAYYCENKDKFKAYALEYYYKNKEDISKRQSEYQKENKQKLSKHYSEYRANNKEKIKNQSKIYYEKNKNEIKRKQLLYVEKNKGHLKKYWAEYRQMPDVKEKRNLKNKERFHTDSKYRINSIISNGIKDNLKFGKNGISWLKLVDFTIEELEKRLKETIPEGYSWQNFLNGELHIDHIIPKSKFNYEKPSDPDFKKAWSIKNLQLLPAKENLIKGAKLEKPLQMSLIYG